MYRVGIIGCGGIVINKHIADLAADPRAKVTAICDASPDALSHAKAALREKGVPRVHTYGDYPQMLEREKLDVCLVATPHAMHFAHSLASLEAGAHVLLEKPAVGTISQIRALRKKAADKGLLCGVAYQRHVARPFRWIRRALREGRLGRLQFLEVVVAQNWKGIARSWRKDPALSIGGFLFDTGSHVVALMLWLTGLAPARVSAFVEYEKPGIDTNAAVAIAFKGGAFANATFVGAAAEGWYEHIMIWAEGGTVAVKGGQVSFTDGSGWTAEPDGLEEVPDSNVVANFFDAIEGRGAGALGTDLVLAEGVLRLTRAIYASAKNHEVVAFK